MTRYTNIKVNISNGQKEMLQHAIKAGCSALSIRLGHEDLEGDDILAVSNSQAKKLAKAHKNGRGITIRMSSKQLKHNTKIDGGFLGLLAGLAASSTDDSENRFIGVRRLVLFTRKPHQEYKKRWSLVFTSRKEDAFVKWKRMDLDYT